MNIQIISATGVDSTGLSAFDAALHTSDNGWVQDKYTGKGLFVERTGYDERIVRDDIIRSLSALMKTRRIEAGHIRTVAIVDEPTGQAVSALVVPVYQTECWRNYLGPLEK